MKRIYPLGILLTLAALGGCKTEDVLDKIFPPPSNNPLDRLPPETQTGQRTFGCLVNGQAWNQAGNPFSGPVMTCSYLNRRLVIVTNRNGSFNGVGTSQRISLVLDKITQEGSYPVNDSIYRVAEYEDFNSGCTLTTTATQTGVVELTRFDPVARVAAGRFSFTLEKPGCGRVVATDGRFDCSF